MKVIYLKFNITPHDDTRCRRLSPHWNQFRRWLTSRLKILPAQREWIYDFNFPSPFQEHVKNFRPKLLVLSGNPTHRVNLQIIKIHNSDFTRNHISWSLPFLSASHWLSLRCLSLILPICWLRSSPSSSAGDDDAGFNIHHNDIMRSEVLTDEIPKNTPKLREEVQMWLKHKRIQGFYDVLQVSDWHQDNDDDFSW